MLVLVTGGAGYIGSHTAKALLETGMEVVVLDNLVHGHRDIVEDVLKIPLIKGDVGDRELINKIISGNHKATSFKKIDAVMHFAAYAYVGESMNKPIKYYKNNVVNSLTLLESIKDEGEIRGAAIPFVFSSTCATYGSPSKEEIPISETCKTKPINPYGQSKLMVEKIISDLGKAHGLTSVIFRYFNAAGAHCDGEIGEDHDPETHLIPLLLDVALGKRNHIEIFGDDYETPDGTCIRDYIHVSDLADAHVLGLKHLISNPGQHIYNLGSGQGYSVKEVVNEAIKVTGRHITAQRKPRRAGDPPVLYASAQKAKKELKWQPKYQDLNSIISHAWKWHQRRFSATTRTCQIN